MWPKKSLEMKHFSKSASVDSDLQNISNVQLNTIFDWLRDIHGQNIRLLNLLKVLTNEIQSSSPLGESTSLPEFTQDV